MFRKLSGRGAGDEALRVAAFGKHPAWDDHIPDLGVDSQQLVEIKRVLYLEGIGGNIDSGAWDGAADGAARPEFEHLFAWGEKREAALGRLWASSDGKGRTRYPMVVCAEGAADLLRRHAPLIAGRLDEVRRACPAILGAAEVAALVRHTALDLRRSVGGRESPEGGGAAAGGAGLLARLGSHESMRAGGVEREGLLRLLYAIEADLPEFRRRSGRTSSWMARAAGPPRGQHLRVPRCAATAEAACALWTDVLRHLMLDGAPRWVLCPLEQPWVDLVVGPAGADELRCLRLSPGELPLTTDIPYAMDDEFRARAGALIDGEG